MGILSIKYVDKVLFFFNEIVGVEDFKGFRVIFQVLHQSTISDISRYRRRASLSVVTFLKILQSFANRRILLEGEVK